MLTQKEAELYLKTEGVSPITCRYSRDIKDNAGVIRASLMILELPLSRLITLQMKRGFGFGPILKG
jgi:hypothetical protein